MDNSDTWSQAEYDKWLNDVDTEEDAWSEDELQSELDELTARVDIVEADVAQLKESLVDALPNLWRILPTSNLDGKPLKVPPKQEPPSTPPQL